MSDFEAMLAPLVEAIASNQPVDRSVLDGLEKRPEQLTVVGRSMNDIDRSGLRIELIERLSVAKFDHRLVLEVLRRDYRRAAYRGEGAEAAGVAWMVVLLYHAWGDWITDASMSSWITPTLVRCHRRRAGMAARPVGWEGQG